MKKHVLGIFLLLFVLTLTSCEEAEDTSFEITFDHENMETVEAELDETIELPFLEDENRFFLGWEDDLGTIHTDSYIVDGDMTLTPVFELFEDVLELEFDDTEMTVSITSYQGAAPYVKIPHTIDDYIVRLIDREAFVETDVTRVDIPMTVYGIRMHAFKGMPNLEEVHFYGEYLGTVETILDKDDFDEIIDTNEVCQTTSMDDEPTEDNPWIFEDGCPIVKVTDQTITKGPDGKVYGTYDVEQPAGEVSHLLLSQNFGIEPFTGSDNLSTITLPDKYEGSVSRIFNGLDNLEAVYIENHPILYSENGILYGNDDSLVYYPSGLLTEDFVLPEHIEHIYGYMGVFYGSRMETLTLHESVTFDNGVFAGLTGLKNIVIDGENPAYTAIDGVVYNSDETALLVYPAGKEATTYTTPNNITIIEEYAFMNQQYIEHLIISEGVEWILHHAFFTMPSLTTVDIASSVEYIEEGDFRQPSDVLGNLDTVIIRNDSDVIQAPGISFRETDTLEIYVPDALITAYEEDMYWQHYAEYFVPLSDLDT